MSAGAYAGPRNCPNCSYPIPPGSPSLCPNCQHPLIMEGEHNRSGALATTGPDNPTEDRDPDDTLISSAPLVPPHLRPKPAEHATPEQPAAAPPPAPPTRPPSRPWATVGLVALSLVLAVALGYVAFRVARPIFGPSVTGEVTANPTTPDPTSSSPPSSTPTDEPTPTDQPTPTPEPKRIKNVKAKASSTLPPDNYTYEVENTLDRDPTTAWNSNGSLIGPLAKVTLTYRFSKPVQLQEIEIYNGYQRSEQTFIANARVRRVLVSTDATEQSFKLKDKVGKQTVTHDFGRTDRVVLTIEAVYRDETTRYNDVALSEVTFFGI